MIPSRVRLQTVLAVIGLAIGAAASQAEVVRIEIASRELFANGQAFGSTGAYERITGKLHFEVDPDHPANRHIVDISLAPRTANGKVPFSADFFLLQPADASRGNGALLYDVNNRGNKLVLHALNGVGGNNPRTPADAGNGFLMRQGYAILWSGWNGDVLPGGDRLQLELPVATSPKGPVTGRVYAEICVDRLVKSAPLVWGGTRVYPAADIHERSAELTMRPHRSAEPILVPRDAWAFAREEDGRVIPDPTHLYVKAGFKPGWLYDLVYTARDPRVSGLGLAAVRDAVSFFRYAATTEGSLGNPLAGRIQRAYGFGISQSGRFLQDLLYQDFNGDEHQRTVFDGCFIHVAAAGRTLLNERFAQITRHGSQHEENLYPTDAFPFTTVPSEDPLTGRRGDWLARSRASRHLPKLILTVTSTEYWGRGGSLLHTDVEGRRDVELDPAVRLYHIAGGHHTFSTPGDKGIAAYAPNGLDYTPLLRALLVCLDEWVTAGREPPASAYPRIADGTLVSLEEYQRMFPVIPGLSVPSAMYVPLRLDLGPRYATHGIADFVPPRVGPPYRVLVPAVDADGNETAGVRLPQISVPLATYTGWNVRAEPFGAPGALTRWQGAQFPLPRMRAAGPVEGTSGTSAITDPRPSVLERYPTREAYIMKIRRACEELRDRRLMLDEDIELTIEKLAAAWPSQ
ncbi:MAG TPA: alpha/beta hydrolase domain-containing protein [Phycisphaerae bacterium]|nr:alpha/beta hydrolase domain-containing protein [Phycisphaerae bacterium]HOJ73665.1 alpha/beta hydrolase domain-containing protein [Phycisphaerae bacterium]HOM50312.1 alpha/beta hydrolase domain-containing protein [Phycisphaerae bacterium]HON65733.1 alpha/beta hydrolase domain-containing protein [Phycisphaerae bacterium]HOQ84846.1 alpha/beta hydrolase domain-containing protein [Phycisphaerae bacterium]